MWRSLGNISVEPRSSGSQTSSSPLSPYQKHLPDRFIPSFDIWLFSSLCGTECFSMPLSWFCFDTYVAVASAILGFVILMAPLDPLRSRWRRNAHTFCRNKRFDLHRKVLANECLDMIYPLLSSDGGRESIFCSFIHFLQPEFHFVLPFTVAILRSFSLKHPKSLFLHISTSGIRAPTNTTKWQCQHNTPPNP